jgi:serine/threonine-protein kinase HipA
VSRSTTVGQVTGGAVLMAERLEVRLHGEHVGWIIRGSRRDRIEFEWIDGYEPGPVTLTESFGAIRSVAPSAAASSFFGGYALEGRQRERLTQRRGIGNPTDLYAMLREFGSSIAGAVTVSDPQTARRTQPRYELIRDGEIIARLRRAVSDGDLGSDDQSRSMLAGYQPKLLLARFDGQWYLPRGRAHSTHILKPRLEGRPDGLAREHYGHALAAELGFARYRTELVGSGARQYWSSSATTGLWTGRLSPLSTKRTPPRRSAWTGSTITQSSRTPRFRATPVG